MLPRLTRPLCAALTTAALALPALVAAGPTARAEQERDRGRSGGERVVATMVTGHARHTSDREVGPIAPYVDPRLETPTFRSRATSEQLAPGVRYTAFTQHDARGPVRAHLISVDLDQKGVALDVVNPGKVASTATVKTLARKRGAVAAVNGDFFDIGRSGAPLGVTRSPRRGLLNARASGWNQAFYLTRKGRPQFGDVPLIGEIKQRPQADVTNLNSHLVLPGGIGIYTDRWGSSPGYSVTQGQTKNVRQVVVRGGRVVSNRGKLTPGRKIDGLVLVGRGEGAKQLRKLRNGAARVTWQLKGRPRLVVTGSKLLVDDGKVAVTDDAEMHPRTAVGIDRDTGEVLLLVVDGRSASSRGYTMLELARLMVDLGADEALNLDGGGSSTMLGKRGKGYRALNDPSDGRLRQVANALTVSYSR